MAKNNVEKLIETLALFDDGLTTVCADLISDEILDGLTGGGGGWFIEPVLYGHSFDLISVSWNVRLTLFGREQWTIFKDRGVI